MTASRFRSRLRQKPPSRPARREAVMRIELRKVGYSARLSEETSAFSTDVWIDGVKVG